MPHCVSSRWKSPTFLYWIFEKATKCLSKSCAQKALLHLNFPSANFSYLLRSFLNWISQLLSPPQMRLLHLEFTFKHNQWFFHHQHLLHFLACAVSFTFWFSKVKQKFDASIFYMDALKFNLRSYIGKKGPWHAKNYPRLAVYFGFLSHFKVDFWPFFTIFHYFGSFSRHFWGVLLGNYFEFFVIFSVLVFFMPFWAF